MRVRVRLCVRESLVTHVTLVTRLIRKGFFETHHVTEHVTRPDHVTQHT
ncbi:hypothetical protein GCM10008094_06650 [Aidingimonas halophila]|nr:hypothetical protein GCM10008094_06650 [Aidingimonas halophila]